MTENFVTDVVVLYYHADASTVGATENSAGTLFFNFFTMQQMLLSADYNNDSCVKIY